jgi:hypothetical protein
MKRNVRNGLVQAMNKRHATSKPMKDRRGKRLNNKKNSWKGEL